MQIVIVLEMMQWTCVSPTCGCLRS